MGWTPQLKAIFVLAARLGLFTPLAGVTKVRSSSDSALSTLYTGALQSLGAAREEVGVDGESVDTAGALTEVLSASLTKTSQIPFPTKQTTRGRYSATLCKRIGTPLIMSAFDNSAC